MNSEENINLVSLENEEKLNLDKLFDFVIMSLLMVREIFSTLVYLAMIVGVIFRVHRNRIKVISMDILIVSLGNCRFDSVYCFDYSLLDLIWHLENLLSCRYTVYSFINGHVISFISTIWRKRQSY